MNAHEKTESKRLAELQPTEYEKQTWEGRQIEDAKDPSSCGSCSLSIHVMQVREVDSWVQGRLAYWLKLYRQSKSVEPPPRYEVRQMLFGGAAIFDTREQMWVDLDSVAKILNEMVPNTEEA